MADSAAPPQPPPPPAPPSTTPPPANFSRPGHRRSHSLSESAHSIAHGVHDSLNNGAHSISERTHSMSSSIHDSLHNGAERVRQRSHTFSEMAQDTSGHFHEAMHERAHGAHLKLQHAGQSISDAVHQIPHPHRSDSLREAGRRASGELHRVASHVPHHPTHVPDKLHTAAHSAKDRVLHPGQHMRLPHLKQPHVPGNIKNAAHKVADHIHVPHVRLPIHRKPSLKGLHVHHHHDKNSSDNTQVDDGNAAVQPGAAPQAASEYRVEGGDVQGAQAIAAAEGLGASVVGAAAVIAGATAIASAAPANEPTPLDRSLPSAPPSTSNNPFLAPQQPASAVPAATPVSAAVRPATAPPPPPAAPAAAVATATPSRTPEMTQIGPPMTMSRFYGSTENLVQPEDQNPAVASTQPKPKSPASPRVTRPHGPGFFAWPLPDPDWEHPVHDTGHPIMFTCCIGKPRLLEIEKHCCWNGMIDHKTGEEKSEHWYHHLWRQKWFMYSVVGLGLLSVILASSLSATLADKKKDHHPSMSPPTNKSLSIDPVAEAVSLNFPDPALLYDNGTWYAFATNQGAGILPDITKNVQPLPPNSTANIQMASSSDFQNWTVLGAVDPLPMVGQWAVQGRIINRLAKANVWAPSVIQRPSDGNYVMYYSAAAANNSRIHCLGAATSTSDSPAGPYSALPDALACPVEQGGAIDADAFIDKDNKVYVTWKVDGNSIGHGGSCGNGVAPQVDTPIMMQPMEADGLTPIGAPITLLHREAEDGPLIEAPNLVRSDDGTYFLFFSSGCTRETTYNLKYATAQNVTGPYTRAKTPLIRTSDWGLTAPGSADIKKNPDGGFSIAFHARVWNEYGGVRAMFTSKVKLSNSTASLLAQPKAENAFTKDNSTLAQPAGLNQTLPSGNETAFGAVQGLVEAIQSQNNIGSATATGSSVEQTDEPTPVAFGTSASTTDASDFGAAAADAGSFVITGLSPSASAGLDSIAGKAMVAKPDNFVSASALQMHRRGRFRRSLENI